ncbi:hypothetical protein H1P_2360002 [Hyella patelloides LEGE 07179]|uniref:Uncharacterized protein n=1 Tax=Hyella patelloides LEGE 07179 TaxID=945734 RepID=A0A563VRG3_9CYAN|nr:hypothetical protein H1P_2360002 [Hyella patelloides LEGE 07179]
MEFLSEEKKEPPTRWVCSGSSFKPKLSNNYLGRISEFYAFLTFLNIFVLPTEHD